MAMARGSPGGLGAGGKAAGTSVAAEAHLLLPRVLPKDVTQQCTHSLSVRT